VSDRARKRRLISRAAKRRRRHPPNAPVASADTSAKKFREEIAKAIEAGPYWEPENIAHFRIQRAGALGLKEIAEEFQRHAKKLSVSDEAALACELLGLTRRMVALMNWSAEAGKLGDEPRFHETWPINYAPDASKGASKWEAANGLYRKLGCGKNAIIKRIPGQVDYHNRWTALAVDGVGAALLARDKAASWVDEKIKNAKWREHRTSQPHGHTKIEWDYYLCQDGHLIAWPAWAERSKGLPDKLTSDNWKEFLPVVRELVRIYLLMDEKIMSEYLTAALPQDQRYEVKKWDASIFNRELMNHVRTKLETLAFR
jgi:hypothetical protein